MIPLNATCTEEETLLRIAIVGVYKCFRSYLFAPSAIASLIILLTYFYFCFTFPLTIVTRVAFQRKIRIILSIITFLTIGYHSPASTSWKKRKILQNDRNCMMHVQCWGLSSNHCIKSGDRQVTCWKSRARGPNRGHSPITDLAIITDVKHLARLTIATKDARCFTKTHHLNPPLLNTLDSTLPVASLSVGLSISHRRTIWEPSVIWSRFVRNEFNDAHIFPFFHRIDSLRLVINRSDFEATNNDSNNLSHFCIYSSAGNNRTVE